MKYFLVLSKFDFKNFTAYFPDNGIALLSACIKEAGQEVSFFDMNMSFDEKEFELSLKNDKPEIVGFKLFYNNIESSIRLAKLAKKILPESLIIAGGPHVTIYKETIFKITQIFDILVVGEGEKAIIEIGEYYELKRKLENVRNIIYKDSHGLVANDIELIENIDELPFPDWDILPLSNYFPILQINTSRGCPNQCSFCIHNAILCRDNKLQDFTYKKRKDILKVNYYRKKSFERIKNELDFNRKKHHVQLFVIPDSTPDTKMLIKLSDYIITNKIRINWSCFARIGQFTDKLYKKFAQAGCVSMFFGIESGDENLLKIIGKNYKKERIIQSIAQAEKNGIQTICSFIIGHPGENNNTILETKDLTLKLDSDSIFFNPFVLEPESLISYNPLDFGIELVTNWKEKTVFLPKRIEPYEVYYYKIENIQNDIWYKKIADKYIQNKIPIDADIFDTEYIKVLATRLNFNSKLLFTKLDNLTKSNDNSHIEEFINECHQKCKNH